MWKTFQSMMPDVGVHIRLTPVREEEMLSFRTHHTAVVLGHGLAYDGVRDAFPHRDPPDAGLRPCVRCIYRGRIMSGTTKSYPGTCRMGKIYE